MVLIGFIGKVILTIFGISLLIFVHELGHFVVAKILNMKVYEFVLGYGSKLFSFKIGETVYGITKIPFGGYVKLEDIKPEEISFEEDRLPVLGKQSLWKRVLVIVGGPLMNLILPIFLLAVIFMAGIPYPTTIIEEVMLYSPAVEAGLKAGDEIVCIECSEIKDWGEATKIIRENPNKTLDFVVIRDNKKINLTATIAEKDNHGFLGIGVKLGTKKYGVLSAFYEGLKATVGIVVILFKLLVSFIQGKQMTGFTGEIIGPVGLAKETFASIQRGIIDYLGVLAQMSIGMGIANLIPVPPLDGGKLVLMGYELVVRKPLKVKTMLIIQAIGIALLLFLMISVTFSDIFGIFALGGR